MQELVRSGDISVSSSQEHESAFESAEKKKPIGNKRTMEMYSHVAALQKGADAIENIAEVGRKRTKVAEEAF